MSFVFDFKCEKCDSTIKGHEGMFVFGIRCSKCSHVNKQYVVKELTIIQENKTKYNHLVEEARKLMRKKFKEK